MPLVEMLRNERLEGVRYRKGTSVEVDAATAEKLVKIRAGVIIPSGGVANMMPGARIPPGSWVGVRAPEGDET